jgi:hypothetical protein
MRKQNLRFPFMFSVSLFFFYSYMRNRMNCISLFLNRRMQVKRARNIKYCYYMQTFYVEEKRMKTCARKLLLKNTWLIQPL